MEFFEPILAIIPSIKAVLLAIIALGFLIFIHELGHFLAAKRAGIKVNTFSIGFGPKIVGFRRGDTEYKLSWLPFGGYVQMEGENPSEQTGAEGEFASASLGKRAFVVIAGPAVNLLFGVLAYWCVFSVGLNADAVRFYNVFTGQSIDKTQEGVQIGWLADDGPAAVGGVIPGDIIVSVNGYQISNWETFSQEIQLNPEKELELVVQRDGNLKTLTVVPEAVSNPRVEYGRLNVLKQDDVIVAEIDEGSLAAQVGIKVGDQIDTINGEKIYNVPYFVPGIWQPESDWRIKKYQTIYESIDQNRDSLNLGIRRGDETLSFQLPVQLQMKVDVEKNSTAQKAGIETGDILTTFNGKAMDSKSLHSELKAAGNNSVTLGLIRERVEKTVTLSPADATKPDVEGTFYGLRWYTSLSGMELKALEIPTQKYNLFSAFGKGIEATWLTCTSITRILKRLLSGEVSPSHLSGPIGIVHITSETAKVGLTTVLFFIGFISINLAIVNLLPIPIADGGHLLFFAMEKIRGRPVPRKAQEIIQQVSFILLIAFFLYITWFDSLTLFHNIRN
ncbi:MAG: RIP metalloprotease RseP [Candidatus Poribacteria bacterium]|nr:RIP metalloprotease RseP [Candidatus Poribacteria bacterium]